MENGRFREYGAASPLISNIYLYIYYKVPLEKSDYYNSADVKADVKIASQYGYLIVILYPHFAPG